MWKWGVWCVFYEWTYICQNQSIIDYSERVIVGWFLSKNKQFQWLYVFFLFLLLCCHLLFSSKSNLIKIIYWVIMNGILNLHLQDLLNRLITTLPHSFILNPSTMTEDFFFHIFIWHHRIRCICNLFKVFECAKFLWYFKMLRLVSQNCSICHFYKRDVHEKLQNKYTKKLTRRLPAVFWKE